MSAYKPSDIATPGAQAYTKQVKSKLKGNMDNLAKQRPIVPIQGYKPKGTK